MRLKGLPWLGLLALVVLGATEAAGAPGMRLYPGVAPGSEGWTQEETIRKTALGEVRTNVRDPQLFAYPADPARANGAAVILLPGGALRALFVEAEADQMIRRFTREGVAVFLLNYRVLQVAPQPSAGAAGPGPPVPGPMHLPSVVIRNANANPAPNDQALTTVLDLAIADAQQALRMVRAHASQWHIDPARVGFVGSSAGGGVALGTVVRPADGAVPNFIATLYGPSLLDVTVPPDAPPLFMATEANHGPVTDGLLALFSVWKAAGRPAELHVLEVPSPGLPTALWIDRFLAWLTEQRMLPATPGQPGR